MKKNILALILLIACVQVFGQYPKLIVQFKNKAGNKFSVLDPSKFLSSRALARRTRYKITTDSTDLPITESYIDSVRLAGNVTILSQSKWLNQLLIQSTDNNAINKIKNLSFVSAVNGIGFRLMTTTDPVDKFKEPIKSEVLPIANRTTADHFNYGNNYNQVHIHEGEFLHNKGYRGQNMHISVLDAGFSQYKLVTAFDSMRLNNQLLGEKDFVSFDNSVSEDDSHGMYCLSTMATNWPGRMVGTSPEASYWLIRTENAFSEYPIEEFNWVVGAEFADSTGSDMISSSLGYSDFDDPAFNHTYNDFYKNSTAVSKGAALASKKGIIVMNSAGNSGQQSWKYLNFPADADSVCSVGAINAAGQIASFSSYGYPGKTKPNIVSVGDGTVIAGYSNQPSNGSGTSFSNPNVAGLIACLWQAFPAFNNMKILDAVYKSSNRYTAPTNQYGYGVPNFRVAYRSLKKEENTAKYGADWMWVSPNPFSNKLDVTLIGRIDGKATIELFNAANTKVATKNLTTELEEVYDLSFSNLDSLPGGNYLVRYTDSLNTRSIMVQKEGISESWIKATPNPFKNSITTSFIAPEDGKIALRLVDAKGKKVAEVSKVVTSGQQQIIAIQTSTLQKGTYILQYVGNKKQTSIKVIKL